MENVQNKTRTKKLIYLSLLISAGIALHIIESFLPVPIAVPGAKLGLANIITLLALTMYGFKEGLAVAILRCVLATLLGGSPSSLIYSLMGALLALILMYVMYFHTGNLFSLIGVSIVGAEAHNFAQITVASIILQNVGIYIYLPVLMLVGIVSGYFVGLSATFVKRVLEKNMFSIKSRIL